MQPIQGDQGVVFIPDYEDADDDSDDSSWSENDEIKKPKTSTTKFNLKKIPDNIAKFWKEHQKIKPAEYFTLPESQNVRRQVCAKVITRQDTIVECIDCRVDETCVICLECFENGNHEGHRFAVHKAVGGCCDCGDAQAWSEKGFCKNHSGQFKDFEIKNEIQDQFNEVFDGLFYLYFYSQKSTEHIGTFSRVLIKFLTELNDSDLYYNKLTYQNLIRKLPKMYSLDEEIDSRTILENILTYEISGKKIDQWFQFFMLLFPFYPIKNAITNHYIKNYHLIINGNQQASKVACSISCQLLTSYKVIKEYTENNSEGLAQRIKYPDDLDLIENISSTIFFDMNFLSKLQEGVNFSYWKMHIKSGIDSIFGYYDVLKKKVKQSVGQGQSQINIKYISVSQIEYSLISQIAKVIGCIRHDEETLSLLIKFLYKKATSQSLDCKLILYRPYERCLAMALFAYFELNLQNATKAKVSDLRKILNVKEAQFQLACLLMYKRMLKTFFQYSRSLMESGYQNSLYQYLYFYKINDRLMSVADIIMLKLMILIGNFEPSITIQSIIEFEPQEEIEEYEQSFIKKKQTFLEIVLKEINLLYISKSYEIFLANQISPKCKIYDPEIHQLLLRVLKEDNGLISLKEFKKYEVHLFHPSSTAEDQIKQICSVSKEKKSFIIDPKKLQNTGMNYNNFRLNVEKKGNFQNPNKTFPFIDGYNKIIFAQLWNEESTKKLANLFVTLQRYGASKNQEQKKVLLSDIGLISLIQRQFGLFEYELLMEKILQKEENRKYFPVDFAKQLGIQKMEEEGTNELKLQKKKTILDKKKRMKEQGNKFLDGFKDQQQVNDKEQMVDEKMQCCICRNKNPNQFVCLVNVCVRNHEKLLKVGEGIQCLSFTTCNHIYDFNCIKKKFITKKMKNSIFCELCKVPANALFPVTNNIDLKNRFSERLGYIVQSFKKNANVWEQVLKSFYHFVLLASVNIEVCFSKRLNLYKKLFQNFVKNIEKNVVEELFIKFKEKKLSIKFDHKKQQGGERKVQMFENLRIGFLEQLQLNQMNEEQGLLQNLISLMYNQSREFNEQQQDRMEEEPEQEQNTEQKYNYSSFFIATMKEIFKILNKQEENIESINPIIVLCIKALKNPQFQLNSGYQFPKIGSVLKELPNHYTPIGSFKRCTACNELSSDLLLCLICHWVGCKKCEKGNISQHIQKNHGEIGAYMYVSSTKACFYINEIQFSSMIGELYQDEWGNSVQLNKEWDNFQLNQALVNKMERSLKYDDIITGKTGR